MSRIKSISKNIKYNAASKIITLIINFALLPFIISHTGKEIYGIYILVTTITGFLGIMDFGVTGAVIKYTAEFSGKGDSKRVNEVISASFSFYMIIGIIAAVILLILSFYFDMFFNVGRANKEIATQLFWVAAGASVFIWPGRNFEWALYGFQQYKWLAISNIVTAVLTGVSAYLIFTNDLSIVYYLAVSYVFTIPRYAIAYIIISGHLLRQKVVFPYFNGDTLKMIFGFSFYAFLTTLGSILIFQLDDFIVGAFVSVSAVSLYNVGYNLQNALRATNSLIGGPLFPAYADMEGRGEYDKQKMMLLKGTKYLTMIFTPMVVITIFFAAPLIKNWMGNGFVDSILPAQVLISFWIFNSILEVGTGMLTAKGYVKVIFKIWVINAFINLSLSLILVKYLGILGVALGTTIPMILINFPLSLYQILKVFNITLKEYFNLTIKSNLMIYLLAAILSILFQKTLLPTNVWMVFLEMGVVYLLTLVAGYRWALLVKERQELQAIVRF
ncbi:MAG: flippase [Nitrospinota bacterium]